MAPLQRFFRSLRCELSLEFTVALRSDASFCVSPDRTYVNENTAPPLSCLYKTATFKSLPISAVLIDYKGREGRYLYERGAQGVLSGVHCAWPPNAAAAVEAHSLLAVTSMGHSACWQALWPPWTHKMLSSPLNQLHSLWDLPSRCLLGRIVVSEG